LLICHTASSHNLLIQCKICVLTGLYCIHTAFIAFQRQVLKALKFKDLTVLVIFLTNFNVCLPLVTALRRFNTLPKSNTKKIHSLNLARSLQYSNSNAIKRLNTKNKTPVAAGVLSGFSPSYVYNLVKSYRRLFYLLASLALEHVAVNVVNAEACDCTDDCHDRTDDWKECVWKIFNC